MYACCEPAAADAGEMHLKSKALNCMRFKAKAKIFLQQQSNRLQVFVRLRAQRRHWTEWMALHRLLLQEKANAKQALAVTERFVACCNRALLSKAFRSLQKATHEAVFLEAGYDTSGQLICLRLMPHH